MREDGSSGSSPVYHGGPPPTQGQQAPPAENARLFKAVSYDLDDSETVEYWGMRLPNGAVSACQPNGRGTTLSDDAERFAARRGCDLVWLT